MQEDTRDVGVKASAAAIGALAGTAVAGPVGGIVSAAVTPILEPLMMKVFEEFSSDSRESATGVLVEAAEHAGTGPTEFAEQVRRGEMQRLVGGAAFAAGARTRNKDKIRGLGRALADGILAEDTAKLDETHLILRAMDDLEAPHIAVLNYLANFWPPTLAAGGTVVREPAPLNAADHAERAWRGRPRWTVQQVIAAREGFADAVPSLLGTLQRHGLASAEQDLKKMLDDYDKATKKAQSATSRSSQTPKFDTTKLEDRWAATGFAHRVLAYLLAEGVAVSPADAQ
ncbi:hypothetical protein [Myceligenerans crystallogenes]|uniref:DUF4393 domain-containing protein n=1 Tax=Myceligenerans crystallogenes TaxID=316335 RepID=A0ABN2NH19_9MICO